MNLRAGLTRLALEAMPPKKKQEADPMASHPSWAKYGARFPWQKMLMEEEVKSVPEIAAIPGYEGHGRWDCRSSREALINWVTAHPEFDLVTIMDNGSEVYGLAVVNRSAYALGLRDKKARDKWFGHGGDEDLEAAQKLKAEPTEELSDRAKAVQERAKGKIGRCEDCDALGWRLYPSGDGDVWDTCLTCNEGGKIPFPEMRGSEARTVTAAPEEKPKAEPKKEAPKENKEAPKKEAKPKKQDDTIHCPSCGSTGPWTILDMHLYVHNVPATKLAVSGEGNVYDDTKGESEGWDSVTDGQVQCNKCKKEYDYNDLVALMQNPGNRSEEYKEKFVPGAPSKIPTKAAKKVTVTAFEDEDEDEDDSMDEDDYEFSAYEGPGGWYAKWRTKWTDATEQGPYKSKAAALKSGETDALDEIKLHKSLVDTPGDEAPIYKYNKKKQKWEDSGTTMFDIIEDIGGGIYVVQGDDDNEYAVKKVRADGRDVWGVDEGHDSKRTPGNPSELLKKPGVKHPIPGARMRPQATRTPS